MKQRRPSAFSLLEVSIILLIIAIVVGGIIKSNDLHSKARLATARTLTQTSPVFDIDDLVAWYETSLENSFIIDELEDDGSAISTWYDVSDEKVSRNHATQSTADARPKYYEEIFAGGIPGIEFDGTDDMLDFNGDDLLNSNYTIFVVEKRTADSSDNYFIAGSSNSPNTNLRLGYATDTSLTHSHLGGSNAISHTVEAYSSNKTRIHTFLFNMASGEGKKYWLNGGIATDANSTSQTDPITSFSGSALGRSYEGYIGEVIIFNRNITAKEKQMVEEYLSKKYNVALN